MAAVRNRNTEPEIAVRKLLWSLGYRYRLHCAQLPGTPDLVFSGRRRAVFVHGCFWHGHRCARGKMPASNRSFWLNKIEANRERDKRVKRKLHALGWRALTIWQCQIKKPDILESRLGRFLGPRRVRRSKVL